MAIISALVKVVTAGLATPSGLSAGTPTSGGTFAAGTYYWVITATDFKGRETLVSNEVSATPTTNQQVPLTWTATTAATGYNVYRGTAPATENVLVASVTTNSYTDTGTAGTAATLPTANSTAVPVALASATTPAKWVFVQNPLAQTGNVYVADSFVDALTKQGVGLGPGLFYTFPPCGNSAPYDLALMYADSNTAGDVVSVLYET